MRSLFIAIVSSLLATSAIAQSPQPYKLIVLRGDSDGIAITDYPSAERCQAAKDAIIRLVKFANADKEPRNLPGGGVFIPRRLLLEAYCIPG